jgi:uncharacterized integral membrane protein (TIGR00697 family)
MGTPLVISLYVACELIANITASKPISLFGIVAPGGVFIYALSFTLIDLINEQMGKRGATAVVYAAFGANLLLACYATLIISFPSPAFFTNQEAFNSVLGSTPRIVIASLSAYLISSLLDVQVFDWWKRVIGKRKWARVVASNAVSTGVDSAVFVTVAFWGSLPVLPLIAGQYAIKMGITVASIPLIYTTGAIGAAERR